MAAVIASNEVAKIMAQIRQGESRLDAITASAAGLEQQLKTLMSHKGEATDTPHPMFEQVGTTCWAGRGVGCGVMWGT
jgi:hypothetical protein